MVLCKISKNRKIFDANINITGEIKWIKKSSRGEAIESEVNQENSIKLVRTQIAKQVDDIISWILISTDSNFLEFERNLIPKVYELGRLFMSLFLWKRELHWQEQYDGEVLIVQIDSKATPKEPLAFL